MPTHQWRQVTEYSAKNPLTLDKLPTLLTNYVVKATGAKMQGDLMPAVFASSEFMLIKRSCLEKMVKTFPHLRYIDDTGISMNEAIKSNLYAFFDMEYVRDDNKNKKSPLRVATADEVFCRRCRECGETVWVNTKANVSRMTNEAIMGCMDKLADLMMRASAPKPVAKRALPQLTNSKNAVGGKKI